MSALSQGLPVLVLPLSADQPLHASRYLALGVGKAIEVVKLSLQAIRRAVQELLENRGYRENVRCLRDEMMSLPTLEYAVKLLTKLAVEKTPQINQIV